MRPRGAWLLAALLLPTGAAAELPPVFIGAFETAAAPGLDPAAPIAVTLRLHPRGAERAGGLARWFPGVRVAGPIATFVVDGYPTPRDLPGKALRAPSFYVDFDEPAVERLRAPAVERFGPAPSLDDLARFVDERISRKSMSRLLDPASIAAARGEGDCTEHAVLLAAVARLFGHPARMVHGLAVLEQEGRWVALGHAWTEIHDGRGWRLEDATHPPAGRVLYLPLGVVEDEGPGFAAGSLRALNPLDVARVELAPAGR